MKEVKDNINRWRDIPCSFLDWKNQYCENDDSTPNNLQIQSNLYQITNDVFYRTRTKKKNPQFVWKSQSKPETEWHWRGRPP